MVFTVQEDAVRLDDCCCPEMRNTCCGSCPDPFLLQGSAGMGGRLVFWMLDLAGTTPPAADDDADAAVALDALRREQEIGSVDLQSSTKSAVDCIVDAALVADEIRFRSCFLWLLLLFTF